MPRDDEPKAAKQGEFDADDNNNDDDVFYDVAQISYEDRNYRRASCVEHHVSIVTKVSRGCGSTGNVTLSSNTKVISAQLRVDAAGKLTIDGIVDVNGEVTASCLSGLGSGTEG